MTTNIGENNSTPSPKKMDSNILCGLITFIPASSNFFFIEPNFVDGRTEYTIIVCPRLCKREKILNMRLSEPPVIRRAVMQQMEVIEYLEILFE